MNAGNVIRLKQQKTTVKPREALESHAASCFTWVSFMHHQNTIALSVISTLDEAIRRMSTNDQATPIVSIELENV